MQATQNVYQTFMVRFGQGQTGYTVSYQILNADGTVKTTWATTNVVEIGYGDYGAKILLTTTFTGFIQWRAVKTGQTTLYATEELIVVTDTASSISKLLQIETGRWKIANNQMLFYDADNTTVIYRFNLKDADGTLNSTSVFERIPA